MGVEATNRASHSGTDQVLVDVKLDKGIDISLEDVLDDVTGDNGLSNNALATSIDPVDSGRLLIRAVVSTDGDNVHVLETLVVHDLKSVLDTLGNHVHTHSVTGSSLEADVKVGTGHGSLHLFQTSETRGGVESLLHDGLTLLGVEPKLGSTSSFQSLELNARATSHTVSSQNSNGTATRVDSLAASAGRSDQDTLSGSHRNEVALSIDDKGTGDTNRERHISDNVLAASTVDLGPVVVLVRKLGVVEDVGQLGSGLGARDDRTANLDSAGEILEGLLESITGDLALEREVDDFLIVELMSTLLSEHLIELLLGTDGSSALSGEGNSAVLLGLSIVLVIGARWGKRSDGGRRSGGLHVLSQGKGGRRGIVKLLRLVQLLGVDGVIRHVGVLDAPAGSVEEIAVERHTESKGNHDPLGQDRILQALEDAADHATTIATEIGVIGILNTGRLLSEIVVDGRELKLVANRCKNGHNSFPVSGAGGLENDIQTAGSNLEGVNRRGRHDTAKTTSPRGDAGDGVGAAEWNGAKV